MEFIFTGKVHYKDVTFYINAESIDEAKVKAEKGFYDEMENDGMPYDQEINPNTAQENNKETSC